MAVYRRTYTAGGERRTAARYTIDFADHNRVKRRLPAYRDRGASAELERKLTRLAALRAAGEVPPPELTRYLDALPASARGRLAAWGLTDPARLAAAAPLAVHAGAFRADIIAAGRTERHADDRLGQVLRTAAAGGIATPADVTAGRVTLGLSRLRDGTAAGLLRAAGLSVGRGGETGRGLAARRGERRAGVGASTLNHNLTGFRQFVRWMIRERRAADTPELRGVLDLKGVPEAADPRHQRRAFAVAELRRLIGAAAAGPERFGMGGVERAALYRLAAETGLRAGELRGLRRCDLHLTGDAPTVTVPARIGKNRRAATLPLRPGTAAHLAVLLSGRMPAAAALPVPERREVPKMLRADLADARAAWLAEAAGDGDAAARVEREGSAFLAYRDHDGRVGDFHALRHTMVTNLSSPGVPVKVAQELARHSTPVLTLGRYAHAEADRMAEAVALLPDLAAPPPAVAATGTGGDTGPAAAATRDDGDDRPPLRLAGVAGAAGVAPKVAPKPRRNTVTNGQVDAANNPRPRTPEPAGFGRKTEDFGEWTRPGSNGQPPACKAGALPVELRARAERAAAV